MARRDAQSLTRCWTFRERGPWWGGDLQTIRNLLIASVVGTGTDLAVYPGERQYFDPRDGSKDRLEGVFHPAGESGRPLVLIVHGLTGCEDSIHVRISARHLLDHGFPVLRLNLRGAGPSRPACRATYYAGCSDDVSAVLDQLEPTQTRDGVALLGYSLGANVTLKLLAGLSPGPVRAACAVSPPIELAAAAAQILKPRNRLYHRWLLGRLKAEALAAPLPRTETERARLQALPTIVAFDDAVTAPANGFLDAADYYRRCSGSRFLAEIRVPTLIVHAQNDPWIPFSSFRAVDWATMPTLTGIFPAGGGHVGFHGSGDRAPLHDRLFFDFLNEVLTG